MDQPVGKAGVEDDCRPAFARKELAVGPHLETGRSLHPAVDGQYPEGGDEGADRHRAGRGEMQALAHLVDAEQHDAEKARLPEKRTEEHKYEIQLLMSTTYAV